MNTKFIGFRASKEERAALQRLAEREERSPSDVLRRLIRQAMQNSNRQPLSGSEAQRTAGSA